MIVISSKARNLFFRFLVGLRPSRNDRYQFFNFVLRILFTIWILNIDILLLHDIRNTNN